ncbi:MAG: D-glycerate dehydrogenase [Chloroflexi bacterium]|nr:MAG: D-glycerate dehydrogenase [Chloroflexota bacterium]TMF92077.1 MAG: D-glycerate dehydrogenase [Chloroflexota bacterium]TMG46192.1 MAG: D-glycerate dehydrogenase [Chloroflexota bacterium]
MSTGGRPRVLLMHPILDPGPAILAEAAEVLAYPPNRPLDEASIRQAAEGCVGIVSQLMDPIRETVLSTPGLKCVSNVAVGFDNVDVAAATSHKVMVTNTPGVLDDSTADFAFTLLMATARRIVEADSFTRSGRFRGWAIDMMLGQDIFGATLGIVGVGRIGRGVAHRAKGFNMRVLYYDPQPLPREAEEQLGATRVDLGRLIAESDFISIHVPLTQETHHLFSTQQFNQMKRNAVLVNTSRGPVVDEAALVEALKGRKLAGAGLDVYEREPAVHPGLTPMPNVVLAPHIASATVRTRSEMSAMAARNMATAVRGGRPPNLVNPEVKK